MHIPDREQVRDRPTAHPDDVLREQVAGDVLHIGHRKEVEVTQVEAGDPGGLVQFCGPRALVPACRAEDAHLRRPTGDTG